MPYTTTWVPPDLFMTHKGVNVWHAYNDDCYADGPMTYWFTFDYHGQAREFDVRDLPYGLETDDEDGIRAALARAIDEGWLNGHMPEDPTDNSPPGE